MVMPQKSSLVQHQRHSLCLDLKSASRSPIQLLTTMALIRSTNQAVTVITSPTMHETKTARQIDRHCEGERVSIWKGRRVGRMKIFGEDVMRLRRRKRVQ
jgi:hypothetical protein